MENPKALNKEGKFINGRQQIINLLKKLPENEKKLLLKNMMLRNSHLTSQLKRESTSFESISFLEDSVLQNSLENIEPQIIGLALKGMKPTFQKKILKLLPRHTAQEAFTIMKTHLKNGNQLKLKAQKKILSEISIYL